MAVDLDTVSQTIDVSLQFSDGTRSRYVPFQITFDNQDGRMIIDTVDQSQPARDVIDRYRGVIVHSLQTRLEEQKAKEAAREAAINGSRKTGSVSVMSEPVRVIERRSRVKTRGVAYEEPETEVEQSASAPKSGITIANLDYDHVKTFLDEKSIEAVSADEILRKLAHRLAVAHATGRPPGKPVGLDDAAGKTKHEYDLRQINWARDGGNVQIRIYILGEGDNTNYRMVGIMRKDGDAQQKEYLRKLVKQIKNGKV